MLDKLPPAVRHSAFALLAALLFWLQDALPSIQNIPDVLKTVGATLVTLVLAYITPLTQQYGVGAPAPVVDTGETDRTPVADGYVARHGDTDGDGVGI